jgi:cytochrome b561
MSKIHQSAFDTATRIAAGDDGTNYDGVAISLHWATALLVVIQFGLAEIWDYFAKPTQDSMQALHMSFGVVLTLVILARLMWRLIPGHQISSLEIGWVRAASKSTHYLLYALLAAAVALGFAVQWSRGHPVSVFGLFDIPGPFGRLDRPVRRELKEIHNYVAWAIISIAALHALAALYHHYVVKDRVLQRMLPWAIPKRR